MSYWSDLKLTRIDKYSDGIFGYLETTTEVSFLTLERAYFIDNEYKSKIPEGIYTCRKGIHKLVRMRNSFETFELLNVPERTGILFHVGNYNKDSEGCILLGSTISATPDGRMLLNSRTSMKRFMEFFDSVDNFQLTVVDGYLAI